MNMCAICRVVRVDHLCDVCRRGFCQSCGDHRHLVRGPAVNGGAS